ncbi:GNAT family N-acetyltransferase [Cohnella sp. GCM10020058]|uniref:GNAT family N-acetyltransferase n=1 Tax=Cohnella sp. GCM10020058 TaxID=3317330 RepID=UPI003641FCB5
MRIREATAADAALLFEWRNDRSVRERSFDDKPLDWNAHVRWLEGCLSDPDRLLRIAMEDDRPIGVFRLDRISEGTVVISIALAASERGKGAGPRMLRLAAEQCQSRFGSVTIEARIKGDNLYSRKAFAKAGYKLETCIMTLQPPQDVNDWSSGWSSDG